MIHNIIFDMDGVLLDSELCIRTACIKALEAYGVHAAHEDFVPFTGMGEDRFIGGVSEKHGVPFRPEMKAEAYAIYEQLAPELVVVYDGIKELLETLRRRGIRIAVASAADLTKVLINLRCMGVSADDFGAVVTGSDVARKKPFPDLFLAAAEKIGATPAETLVMEDAVAGCQAAKAAGMRCVGVVTDTFDPNLLLDAGAERTVRHTPDILPLLAEF